MPVSDIFKPVILSPNQYPSVFWISTIKHRRVYLSPLPQETSFIKCQQGSCSWIQPKQLP